MDILTIWLVVGGSGVSPYELVWVAFGTNADLLLSLIHPWSPYPHDNGQVPSDLPQPAAQDLLIHDHPPTLEETLEAIRQMKTNKAAGLDCALPQKLFRVAVMQWQMLSIASVLKCT